LAPWAEPYNSVHEFTGDFFHLGNACVNVVSATEKKYESQIDLKKQQQSSLLLA
jgi:hypothetical protein